MSLMSETYIHLRAHRHTIAPLWKSSGWTSPKELKEKKEKKEAATEALGFI